MTWRFFLVWGCCSLWIHPALALDPSKAFHQYRLDVWQAEEGLPLGSVVKVLQTSDGYLWLGGYEELVRFDGERFTVVGRANTAEIRGNNINALAEDPEGGLWIGTDGGGISHFQDGVFTAYTSRDGLAHDKVSALLVGGDGSLWIGTEGGGLSQLKDGRFVSFSSRDGLPHDFIWALAEDHHGDLWIGTAGGLARLAGGHFSTYLEEDGLGDSQVTALSEDRHGNLWIGTAVGTLTRYADGTFTPLIREDPSDRDVTVLHEDRDGTLWIGSHGDGLSRLRDGELTSYGEDDGLTSDVVWSLFEDREGSLWIGTEGGGLNRLRETRFTPVTTRDGLPHDRVWVVDEDREGNLWIGTDGGGLTKLGDGQATTYTEGLASGNVTAIHPGRDGGLWVGTDRGLHRLHRGRISRQLTAEIGPSTVVLALCEDRRGTLWVGTEIAGLHGIRGPAGSGPAGSGPAGSGPAGNGPSVIAYSSADGLPHDTVRALLEDRTGALWIGTDGGLARLADGELTAFPKVTLVRSIHEDEQGTLWISTRGRGLARIRDGEVTMYTTREGLYTDTIYHLLEDGRQNLWMSSNKGIFRVSKGELDDFDRGAVPALRSVVYGTADGMKTVECTGGSEPAGVRTRDGELWFPTSQGLVVIDPEDLKENSLPPPVHIERVESNGVPVERLAVGPGDGLSLPPEVRDLDFRYTALSLLDPKKVRFRHRLEGYDEDWIDAGPRRFAHYTNLPPGSYRFRVIAANNDRVWNEAGDSFELDLQPALHQTRTFQGLCAAAVALFGLAVHRFLVRRLQHNVRELRRMKAELEAKNDEIEASNAEMQRFTYTVSHDLKSPLITIRSYVGMVQRDLAGGKASRMEADLQRIDSAATKMTQLLEDLLELSRVGRVVNPPREVPLGELVHQALENVAGKIAERGVEVVVVPDLGAAFCDPPRLVEVLQNLIENAVKYMGDEPRPRIEIGVRRQADGAVVCVRDNGLGIDPKHHEKVFGLFDQLNPATEGTGIGLALVRRIIEVHGGRIWVESAGEGQGSTFAFTLPEKSVA